MGGRGSGNPNLSGKSGKMTPEAIESRKAASRGTVALSRAIKRQLAEIDPQDSQGRTYGEVIAEKFVKLARGNGPEGPCSVKAVSEILDRTEGRPFQTVVNVTPESREQLATSILASLELLSTDEDEPERVN